MSHLLRMVYVSTSSTPVDGKGGKVQVDIGRILMQSRKNNPKVEVGGVLYFSNNYFFQCLEGDHQTVSRLYENISKDSRHTDVQTLSVKRVNVRQFSNWSMKYVASQDKVGHLINNKGMTEFNPYKFDDAMIEEVLNLFTTEADTTSSPDQNYHSEPRKKQNKGFFSKLFNRY